LKFHSRRRGCARRGSKKYIIIESSSVESKAFIVTVTAVAIPLDGVVTSDDDEQAE